MPDAGDDLDLIGLDLHASAAAKALLAAPEFTVGFSDRDGDTGGQAGQGGDQTLAVGLASGFES
jgi:hypothetical protein